jgi:hypothetical protein
VGATEGTGWGDVVTGPADRVEPGHAEAMRPAMAGTASARKRFERVVPMTAMVAAPGNGGFTPR